MPKTKKKIVIRACEDCSCVDNGALEVIKTIEEATGLAMGEQNTKFDFDRSGCLGGCDFGPNILVNSEIVMGLKPDTVMAEIIKIANSAPLSKKQKEENLNKILESELDMN
jgi:NADH:ubiquinone oxidoreductase subunit E